MTSLARYKSQKKNLIEAKEQKERDELLEVAGITTPLPPTMNNKKPSGDINNFYKMMSVDEGEEYWQGSYKEREQLKALLEK